MKKRALILAIAVAVGCVSAEVEITPEEEQTLLRIEEISTDEDWLIAMGENDLSIVIRSETQAAVDTAQLSAAVAEIVMDPPPAFVSAIHGRQRRSGEVAEAVMGGALVEGEGGYLEPGDEETMRGPYGPYLGRLLEDENRDREAIYEILSGKTGIPAAAVGTAMAEARAAGGEREDR